MTFPAITFCNLNQWRRSKLDNATIDMLSKMHALRQQDPNEFNWTAFYEAIDVSPETLNMTAIALSIEGMGMFLEVMLQQCLWNGVDKCAHTNFTTSITDLGVCYTFNNPSNAKDVLVVDRPGIDNGLTLTLDIDQDEYTAGEFTGAGIKIVLHPQGQRPLMKETGFVVSPGFETLVSIKHKKSLSQPHPYSSNCTKDGLKYSKVYTVPLCLHECKVDYVTRMCGCRNYRYPKESSKKECSPEELHKCIIPQEKAFIESQINKCRCNCPCSSGTFEERLSASYWPGPPTSSELMEIYPKYQDKTAQRENLLRMKIYYEELSYTNVAQFPSYGYGNFASKYIKWYVCRNASLLHFEHNESDMFQSSQQAAQMRMCENK
ncbi:acid-sensing ion channel 2-like [Amphiura filiformis]|uniref:acid-sensing ion channel 2-like n=1 Tax=Amphiura filiformis TaxID=82378 RepID=UPI003B21800C